MAGQRQDGHFTGEALNGVKGISGVKHLKTKENRMSKETEKAAEMNDSLAQEIAIIRVRFNKHFAVTYSGGCYQATDSNGDIFFSNVDLLEVGRFIAGLANQP
jgi:hypothetical protein